MLREMLPREYHDQSCSIARALELVGERWTLLILRDAFLGVRRFDDFRDRLQMSRTVLTTRLNDLVESGLMRREAYQQRPTRYDYLLTEAALGLWPAIAGLAQWGAGQVYPDGAPREFFHQACGTAVRASVRCPHCDVEVPVQQAASRTGPSYAPDERIDAELRDALGRPRDLLDSVR